MAKPIYKQPFVVALEHRGYPCCAVLVFDEDEPMLAAEKAERIARNAHGGILEDWFAYSIQRASQNRTGPRRTICDCAVNNASAKHHLPGCAIHKTERAA